KRSLIISSVGIRPRTIRDWLLKSYDLASPGAGGASVLTAPVSTPWISASISAWSRIFSWLMVRAGRRLLHHEAREVHGLELVGIAAGLGEILADGGERLGAQLLLAGGGGD